VGRIAPRLTEILNDLDRDGHRIAPTFALIDPFGFSGIPYTLLQRLLSNIDAKFSSASWSTPSTAGLSIRDEVIRAHIEETFGTDEPFAHRHGSRTALSPSKTFTITNNEDCLVRSTLRITRQNDRVVYYLSRVHNATGHYKMKEAMWKVDPLGDFSFSDATNPNQEILFLNAPLDNLRSDLIQQFRAAGEILLTGRDFIFNETGFLRKHMREILENLESEGQVKNRACQIERQKAPFRNTYPNVCPDHLL